MKGVYRSTGFQSWGLVMPKNDFIESLSLDFYRESYVKLYCPTLKTSLTALQWFRFDVNKPRLRTKQN
jgi:hypothetical protein